VGAYAVAVAVDVEDGAAMQEASSMAAATMGSSMISTTDGLAIGFDQSCALDRTRADSSACRPLLRTRDGGRTWALAT
jgi:hypothetical protein